MPMLGLVGIVRLSEFNGVTEMERKVYVVDVATFGGTRRYRVEARSESHAERIAARYGVVLSVGEE